MKKFFWGASTSAHQVEGGNKNDWTEWEEKTAHEMPERAKHRQWFKSMPNIYTFLKNHHNYVSGGACDHYHHYEEDFNLAKSLGHNAHRFSIEWSRIEPRKGEFNEQEIEHYRNVIKALQERGLEPFVTLYHWTVPLWFRDEGGWLNRRSPKYFERYVQKLTESYKDLGIKFWITINEPEVYAGHSYLKGEWPPEIRSYRKYFKVMRRLAHTHVLAYRAIKSINPNAEVGIAKNNIYFEAHGINPWNKFLKWCADYFWNYQFLNRIKGEQDFIGLNYYFHNRINWSFGKNENKKVSDMGWEIYPEGLYHVLCGIWRYKKPIYITENGVADEEDKFREEFIREHVMAMRRAMSEGIDVRGYFYWSLLDNFEWDKGFAPRFGLVEIDYVTQDRRVRSSAEAYKNIIEESLRLPENSA
ncbi:MAG: glycoside hydrolase family 1 protein [Patescibacteria group bacterium]